MGRRQTGPMTEPFDDRPAPPPRNGPPADSGSSPAILPGSSELSASSDPDRQFYRSVARIGIQVAEALEYANRQGILHRDVKPSNLLLDNHGNVWVADFGLAKTAEADDLTHTGDILGTIRYMAPERFSGHCDARSDVYSLGLTLYELVALRPAYEASDRHHADGAGAARGAGAAEEAGAGRAAGPGDDRRQGDGAGPGGAIRDGGGAGGGPAAVRGGPADPGAADLAGGAVGRWCRRNKGLATSMGVAAAALVAAVVAGAALRRPADSPRRPRTALCREQQPRARRAVASDQESSPPGWQRADLKTALSESNRRLAMLDLERGRAAFEKGQVGVGMLWTVESLRMAAAAGDEAGQHVALANLSAWRRHHVELKASSRHGDAVTAVAFSPTARPSSPGADKTARLWDAATGRPIGQPWSIRTRVMSVAFSPDGKTILTGSCGQDGAAVGRRHRPAHRPAPDAFGAGGVRGVQPRRQDDPHREL